MPVPDYGVWRAHPVHYNIDHASQDPKSPHLSLYFTETRDKHSDKCHHEYTGSGKEIRGLNRAAINIKSVDKDSRIVYWFNEDLDENHLTDLLADLPRGFHPLGEQQTPDLGLDYIRNNIINIPSGRLLVHDTDTPKNELLDLLEPRMQAAIREHADIYLFGSRSNSNSGSEMHNIHMNQGNMPKYQADDGIFQDGGLIFHFARAKKWIGLFITFTSQSAHTDEQSGHAIGSTTWADFFNEDMKEEHLEGSVAIEEVSVNSRKYQLKNCTEHPLQLASWKIHNSHGEFEKLPSTAKLDAFASEVFEAPKCVLSDQGDNITLLNEKGLKVAGVSYSAQRVKAHSSPLVFAH
ncbi:uncharacterized protein BO80DRAFT_409185 [Aspergillus ibericus CBS 121593]|uniref:Uncharacterized protein n=1 Tax=Aspergillus ibericus CBS 121593 TaxID=1448316 RepID=A0A395GX82_9EURO|nr:hypothetical protein BO80DRAFT_409185 [Aspergillus ibericus CBS 121593]RAK99959.1 hypothetical protein BO80DRAFT_409185 [Aspergillus ibericus CBS 121593]